MAYERVGGVNFHLNKCDDDSVLKVRLDNKGVMYITGKDETQQKCVDVLTVGFQTSTCPNNGRYVEFHKKDPRFFLLRGRGTYSDGQRCMVGNKGPKKGEFPAVGITGTCGDLDEDAALKVDVPTKGNTFWEFLPEPASE